MAYYQVGPITSFQRDSVPAKHLESCLEVCLPLDLTLDQLIAKSDEFPITFPVQAMCCSTLLQELDVTTDLLEANMKSTYPVLHEAALHLYIEFLEYKKRHGTSIERDLYKNMTLVGLVQRLLDKRSVCFCGVRDLYLLRDKTEGAKLWETIGTDKEKSPLLLANYLSYDEIKLAAMLSVSSHTIFINDGNRENRGVPSKENVQRHGVIIGLIGTRLTRRNCMEYEEIVVTKSQNVQKNGYGTKSMFNLSSKNHDWRRLWATFYGLQEPLPQFNDVIDIIRKDDTQRNYLELQSGDMFNNDVYKKRLSVSFETLLLDAEHRAKMLNTTAYIHMVGIGLGVWRISAHQEKLFLEAFAGSVRGMLHVIPHISDVHFAWFQENADCDGIPDGGAISGNEDTVVKVHFSKSPPHAKLTGEHEGKLLVVTYAWDGNALPGNEFWFGSLVTSGDPAAASSSQVAELHNPFINCSRVSGGNLHVATGKWGVLPISDYARSKLQDVN